MTANGPRPGRPVLIYRSVTLALAVGYCIYQLGFGNWSQFGGPLRFLTIWALCMSTVSAAWMLAFQTGATRRRGDAVAMTAAVFNVMTVYLYWKLVFTDPALVRGGPIAWHQDWYLHGLGPALQIADALVIRGAFRLRRLWRGAAALAVLVPGYVVWAETFLQTRNTSPAGSVTSGLPYPFLNNMDWPERLGFYLQYGAVALGVLLGFAVLQWGIGITRRDGGRPARGDVRS